jgi:hypothetical protein
VKERHLTDLGSTPREYEFTAVILAHESMDAAYIEFPFDVEREFGVKGQVKVSATFDGVAYAGSLAKMGHHCHCLGLTKAVRRAIGKAPGDVVRVMLHRDEEPRIVVAPDDLIARLARNEIAKASFDALSYTHKKEYVQWITSAKKEETRRKRIEKTLELLLAKERRT